MWMRERGSSEYQLKPRFTSLIMLYLCTRWDAELFSWRRTGRQGGVLRG